MIKEKEERVGTMENLCQKSVEGNGQVNNICINRKKAPGESPEALNLL